MVEDKLVDRLVEFAKGYDFIESISKGNNPEAHTREEASHPVYYFLGVGRYDGDFEDELSEFGMRLFKDGERCKLMRWPVGGGYVQNELFLGEIVWRRAG